MREELRDRKTRLPYIGNWWGHFLKRTMGAEKMEAPKAKDKPVLLKGS